MRIKTTAASLALVALPATAFVSSKSQSAPKVQPQTSTTLYYRDDVPPIGSAPKWETPNDFDQFLTQCTIQSFTFLLKTLRDDHTIRWLNDFTSPVYEKAEPAQAATEPVRVPAQPKVSLAQAAQSALLEVEKDLLQTQVQLNTIPTLPAAKFDEKSKKFFPPQSLLTMLDEKIATKNAFAAFAKAKLLATTKQEPQTIFFDDLTTMGDVSGMELFTSEFQLLDEPPPPPVSNTGIDSLYTPKGLPKNQINPPILRNNDPPPKNHFAPYGTKPMSAPKNPFSNYQPIAKQQQQISQHNKEQPPLKKSYSPFGNIPKPVSHNQRTGGFMPVPQTSPLYGGGGGDEEEVSSTAQTQPPLEPTKSIASVLKYHGLGILNNTRFPTSEAYFEQLLDQPKEFLLIESPNPRFPDIELDIDPASLCRRMVSVREQIAREFEHDLQVIADMGGLTLKSYNAMIEGRRQQEAADKLQLQKDALENLMPKSIEESISSNNGAKSSENSDSKNKSSQPKMQRANLLFLDRGVGEGESADPAPSPLRKGNFDLLCLLATQEAIHRVLNDPNRQARKSPEYGSNQFLQDFYVKRLLSHFSGDQRFGRSDDFVEELLSTPPRMITIGNTNDDKPNDGHEDSLTKDLTYLVDPVKVAETILNEREVVALQWKQHVASQARADHRVIQNMILTKILGGRTTKDECETVDPDGNDIDDDSCFQ